MAERWRVLALLFLIRTAMAFQFGSVGALGPLVGQTFQVDAAGVGVLIGLYLSPGLVIALPGGAIGRFFGDKGAVLAGLALMTLGGAVSTFGAAWEAQIAGRVIAGVGGVVLNVLMSKMVTDWFAGREIATAMGIFVNSWPVGIAIALVAQRNFDGLRPDRGIGGAGLCGASRSLSPAAGRCFGGRGFSAWRCAVRFADRVVDLGPLQCGAGDDLRIRTDPADGAGLGTGGGEFGDEPRDPGRGGLDPVGRLHC
jgi:MFS family permease